MNWVPEGNLAGFLGGAFLRSGRPRGPGRSLKKMGGFASAVQPPTRPTYLGGLRKHAPQK
jgi:hypothetical protein